MTVRIPLFLRDKLYADFRADRDEAFRLLDRSLSRISNPMQGRAESPEFFTDFSIDWGGKDESEPLFRLMFVDHGQKLQYVVWSLCEIYGNEIAIRDFFKDLKNERHDPHILGVLSLLVEHFKAKPLTERITDNFERFVAWQMNGINGRNYVIRYRYRRMGIDNGFDTLVHLDVNVHTAFKHYEQIVREP